MEARESTLPVPALRQRVIRGAQAQAFGHIVRVIVQVGQVSILASIWGLHLYGEWLILAAVPTYLAFSDIGFFAAATNDMVMAVGRDDRRGALTVFQAISTAIGLLFVALALLLPIVAFSLPLRSLLNLSVMHESTAAWVIVMLGFDTLLTAYAGLLYGAFACVGRYGEGGFVLAVITLGEFSGLATVVALGGGPALAAAAMLGSRLAGTVAMFVLMRHRAPWLQLGRPPAMRKEIRRLLTPALASGAFPAALALNIQGMVILVGIVLSPAATAVFSTLRTLSRAVIQLLASIVTVVNPEVSRAYAERDESLLRTLHRRGCQAAIWLAALIVLILVIAGGTIVHVWTGGKVIANGPLLYEFLAVAAIDSLWFTSLSILFATNRHQRMAVYFTLASVINLPVAYAFVQLWGLQGAAVSLILVELFMLVAVLRHALPAAHDTLAGWIRAVSKPPIFLASVAGLRIRAGAS
jgi:O-antigen/teichoic acid export membrane protein